MENELGVCYCCRCQEKIRIDEEYEGEAIVSAMVLAKETEKIILVCGKCLSLKERKALEDSFKEEVRKT